MPSFEVTPTLNISLKLKDLPTYKWYKLIKSDSIQAGDDSTLIFTTIRASDTGAYYCLVSNRYGTAKSRQFIISMDATSMKPHRIYYFENNASDGTTPQDNNLYYSGSQVTLPGNLGKLTKDGLEFAGWMRILDSDTTFYSAGTKVIMDTVDMSFYVWWTEMPVYTVTYNGNNPSDGTVPIDKNNYTTGSSVTLLGNTGFLEKSGFIFGGWSRDSIQLSNPKQAGDTIITGNQPLQLFAVWSSLPKFKVTYNASSSDRGTPPKDDSLYSIGNIVHVQLNSGNLEKTGFTLAGWSKSTDTAARIYLSDDTILSMQSDFVLYARWSSEKTYNIIYENNGADSGTVPVDDNNYRSGSTATVKDNTGNLRKNGFTFFGWNLQKDGLGATYKPKTIIETEAKDITLYAMWTSKPTYSITYVIDSSVVGTEPVDLNRYIEGDSAAVQQSVSIKKTGYTFSSWNTESNGNGTSVNHGSKLAIMTTNVVLYAQWKINRYEIVYNSNNSVFLKDSINHGILLTVPGKPEREGFTFSGWYKDPQFSELWDFANTPATRNISLYAAWTSTFYTVQFITGTGSGNTSQAVQYGDKATIPDPSPTRAGFNLDGWSKDTSSATTWNFTKDIIISDLTLYAVWAPKTYTITFVAQNGTPATTISNVNHGDTVVKPANPVRQGYNFNKWYTSISFTTPWNFKTVITQPCTLYANFSIKNYQVVFNTIGGSLFTPIQVNHGSTVPEPDSVPRLQGHKFDNWYQDAAGLTLWNFTTDTITAADTLYAKWAIESYRVLIDKQGGGINDSQTVVYNQKVTEPAQPEYSGYTFGDWYTDKTYSRQWAFSSDVVKGPMTLYARWLPCSFVLPEIANLTENPKLPDPFTFLNGTRMTRKSEWGCRRAEILAMASKYIYGPCPPKPDEVTGTVSGGTVTINCRVGTKTASFTATISGSGDAICLELTGGILPSSTKILSLGSGNESKIKILYEISEIIPSLAAAWMVDRVMDVLELNPSSGHDPKKMMVSGCSGCGKSALLVGAYSRIPLTVIAESGGGGASSWRMAEWFRHGDGKTLYRCDTPPQGIDNLEDNILCGPWVATNAQWLRIAAAKVKNLPFDQHMLLACIAPRACCHATNQNDQNEWCFLGSTCEALSAWAAEPVWNALGVPENFGFLMYTETGGVTHCGKPTSATTLADQFFNRVFNGNASATTDVMIIRDSDLQQPQADWPAMWKDWTPPNLQ